MTTYTTIPNADVDTDSPITTSLVTALRDNPTAITEGASGAPTIARGAITPGVGLRWFYDYGTGTDGAITHSATASIAPGMYQATTFQVDATYTVDLTKRGPLIILATTSITINGTLDVSGQGAAGGASASAGQDGRDGILGGTGAGSNASGKIGGDTYLTAGGATSTAGASQSSVTKEMLLASVNFIGNNDDDESPIGGGGGASATGSSGVGGNGGGVIVLCAPVITVGSSGVIDADGTNGTGVSGAGGGGAIIIATPAGGYTDNSTGGVHAAGGTTWYAGGAGFVETITL